MYVSTMKEVTKAVVIQIYYKLLYRDRSFNKITVLLLKNLKFDKNVDQSSKKILFFKEIKIIKTLIIFFTNMRDGFI